MRGGSEALLLEPWFTHERIFKSVSLSVFLFLSFCPSPFLDISTSVFPTHQTHEIVRLPFRDGEGSRAALEGAARELRGSCEKAWGRIGGAPGEQGGARGSVMGPRRGAVRESLSQLPEPGLTCPSVGCCLLYILLGSRYGMLQSAQTCRIATENNRQTLQNG